uniref:Scarecrow-like protein 22 n=1 Tax=Rhizophora mucronata TaxID=61149 RepID=A0A2P2PRG5_RHIMU
MLAKLLTSCCLCFQASS